QSRWTELEQRQQMLSLLRLLIAIFSFFKSPSALRADFLSSNHSKSPPNNFH
ncbi:hypothetical protein M2128_002276, partial [Polynucleobacter sphagniphilus]|nr:hypothetical protein [Polynucleobacter sphagniphilus]